MSFSIFRLFVIIVLVGFMASQQTEPPKKQSGAGKALDYLAYARSYPDGKVDMKAYKTAFKQQRQAVQAKNTADETANWAAIGPKNIGGRTLCLAFHPIDNNIIWAGSASGGIWKTETGGVGIEAWQMIETGFPVLGVAAIAVANNNPNVMYIGTGEVYNYQNSMPAITIRARRGSYGIGILKSEDGGETWVKSLDWDYSDLTGVQDVKIDPIDNNIVYAATTEGLYKTIDGGENWSVILDMPMIVQIEFHPENNQQLYVSVGNQSFPDTGRGIYRTIDAGENFEYLDTGFPTFFSGKTHFDISKQNPDNIIVTVGNLTESQGLYYSDNGGDNWYLANTDDVAKYQGWYSHDVAYNPDNEDEITFVGIDVWQGYANNNFSTLQQRTWWYYWYLDGAPPIGGPEGPPNFIHGDVHAVYWLSDDLIYFASDGGIYRSLDGGQTFEACNGFYQTTQFYANVGISPTNPDLIIGGMQDNATAIYRPNMAWYRVIGGDGHSASWHPTDENIVIASVQNLRIFRANDGGFSFYEITPPLAANETVVRVAPFEFDAKDPNIFYTASNKLWKMDLGTENWETLNEGEPIDGLNPVLTLGLPNNSQQAIYLSTAPNWEPPSKIFVSTDFGESFEDITQGLPDRLFLDIAVLPDEPSTAYVVLGGFGSDHVYKTTDFGQTWESKSTGLPNVPTSTIAIDPDEPNNIYIGNDLGMYFSDDAGETWQTFTEGMPNNSMIMSVNINHSDRKMVVATHGHGMYLGDLVPVEEEPVDTGAVAVNLLDAAVKVYPNPVTDWLTIETDLVVDQVLIHSMNGQLVKQAANKQINLNDLASGTYQLTLLVGDEKLVKQIIKQ